ncbi:methyltransferase family protein [candidate division KSB1 bacterium]
MNRMSAKLINFINRTATGRRRLRMILTPVGGLFFFFIVCLFVVVPLLIDRFLALPALLPEPFNFWTALPLLAGGAVLMFWSAARFLIVRGTPVPFNPPPKLVVSGLYGYTRNPMITGLLAVMFGLGLLFRSISLTLVFTPLFALLMFVELKTIEEPELEKRFGRDYLDYRRQVPMFVPRLSRKLRGKPR